MVAKEERRAERLVELEDLAGHELLRLGALDQRLGRRRFARAELGRDLLAPGPPRRPPGPLAGEVAEDAAQPGPERPRPARPAAQRDLQGVLGEVGGVGRTADQRPGKPPDPLNVRQELLG